MKILTWRAISRTVLMNSSCLAMHLYFRRKGQSGLLIFPPVIEVFSLVLNLMYLFIYYYLVYFLFFGLFFFSSHFPGRDLKKNKIHTLPDNQFSGCWSLRKL